MTGNFTLKDFHASGYTLIELIISLTIAIIGIAIIAPLFHVGSSATDVKTTSRNIASTLKLTRSQAISEQTDKRFILNLKNHTYGINSTQPRQPLPKGLNITLTSSHKEIINEQTGAIHFYPDGSSSGGRISIKNDRSERIIEIDWMTGRIAVSG